MFRGLVILVVQMSDTIVSITITDGYRIWIHPDIAQHSEKAGFPDACGADLNMGLICNTGT